MVFMDSFAISGEEQEKTSAEAQQVLIQKVAAAANRQSTVGDSRTAARPASLRQAAENAALRLLVLRAGHHVTAFVALIGYEFRIGAELGQPARKAHHRAAMGAIRLM
jgi:hypothetical protein